MKKFLYMAVCAATGIVMVSCDKESLEINDYKDLPKNTLQKAKVQHQWSKEGDTIIQNSAYPGPGDEIVPIKPPKP